MTPPSISLSVVRSESAKCCDKVRVYPLENWICKHTGASGRREEVKSCLVLDFFEVFISLD